MCKHTNNYDQDRFCHIITNIWSSTQMHCVCIQNSHQKLRFGQILPHYYEHMSVNPNSLLCRFLGLYRFQPNTSYVLVMANVLDTPRKIHAVCHIYMCVCMYVCECCARYMRYVIYVYMCVCAWMVCKIHAVCHVCVCVCVNVVLVYVYTHIAYV
jgi:hypothetical protein